MRRFGKSIWLAESIAMYSFDSLPLDDQTRFLAYLQEMRAVVECLKFNDLVDAPPEDNQAALGQYKVLRRKMLHILNDHEARCDESP